MKNDNHLVMKFLLPLYIPFIARIIVKVSRQEKSIRQPCAEELQQLEETFVKYLRLVMAHNVTCNSKLFT